MTDFTKGQWAYRGKPTEQVTILTTQRPGDVPVVSMDSNGRMVSHFADGKIYDSGHIGHLDLVPLQTTRPPVEGWVNVYEDSVSCIRKTRGDADSAASHDRIACVFVREVEGGK